MKRNMTVTGDNKDLIVETLRSIAEILIWGDQNDPTVFEFFLEHDMIAMFPKILCQHAGNYIDKQLLQVMTSLFSRALAPLGKSEHDPLTYILRTLGSLVHSRPSSFFLTILAPQLRSGLY